MKDMEWIKDALHYFSYIVKEGKNVTLFVIQADSGNVVRLKVYQNTNRYNIVKAPLEQTWMEFVKETLKHNLGSMNTTYHKGTDIMDYDFEHNFRYIVSTHMVDVDIEPFNVELIPEEYKKINKKLDGRVKYVNTMLENLVYYNIDAGNRRICVGFNKNGHADVNVYKIHFTSIPRLVHDYYADHKRENPDIQAMTYNVSIDDKYKDTDIYSTILKQLVENYHAIVEVYEDGD